MPDLTPQTYYHCGSAESFHATIQGSKKAIYKVAWNKFGHNNPDVQYDYSCTCPSYKFSGGKHCKHIEMVRVSGKHCNWMQFTEGGDVVTNEEGETFCPKCGCEAHAMGWAG